MVVYKKEFSPNAPVGVKVITPELLDGITMFDIKANKNLIVVLTPDLTLDDLSKVSAIKPKRAYFKIEDYPLEILGQQLVSIFKFDALGLVSLISSAPEEFKQKATVFSVKAEGDLSWLKEL